MLLFATLEQTQPSLEVPHFGSHSGTHFVSESLQKYIPNVVQKKAPKSLHNWSSFGTLLGSLGALNALPSPSKWAGKTCSCPTWPPRASKIQCLTALGTFWIPENHTIASNFLITPVLSYLGLQVSHKATLHSTFMHLCHRAIPICNL